jgi:hypothetical protein
MTDVRSGHSLTIVAIFAAGLSGLHCSGKSSAEHEERSQGGSAGTRIAAAGSGNGGFSASGGTSSAGRGAGASETGGGSSSAGSGHTSGSSGTGGMAGGDAGTGGSLAGRDAAGGRAGTSGASGVGGDAGASGGAGAADSCQTWEDCASAVCWEGLDGIRACLDAPTLPAPVECFGSDSDCCTLDSECTDEGTAWCVPNASVTLSCGGAIPSGNTCLRGECGEDVECAPSLPAGATVAMCAPRGAFGLFAATCVYGGCRTNADCTLHDGGECRYELAATHQGCDLHYVLFCAYPNDPCQERHGSCDSPMVCAPEDDYQGRHCVPPPPMYP